MSVYTQAQTAQLQNLQMCLPACLLVLWCMCLCDLG